MSAWKHDDLMRDLAAYLRGPERMVWTDMQLGPSGSPRPDVYTLQKSYSRPQPAAFEVKISRADLRSDTTSGKWQSYLAFAGSVTFAIPDGLATKADIPEKCGLIVRKDAVWRYARRPTIQQCTPPFDACMKLLIDGLSRLSGPAFPPLRKIETWKENASVRLKFGQAVEMAARDLISVEKRIADMKLVADAEYDRARKEVEAHKAYLMSQARAEIAKWDSTRAEICQWLNVDPDASVHEVRRRIQSARENCDADSRVQAAEQRLTMAINSLRQTLAHIERQS